MFFGRFPIYKDLLVVHEKPIYFDIDKSNWMNKSFFNIISNFGIVVNNFYYFTSMHNYSTIKTSLSSSTVIKSYGSGDVYRGLYYDSTASRIITAGCRINKIDIFDLDLNLISSVLSSGECPHGITVYNSKIYVVIYLTSNVAVISNGVIENTFPIQCYHLASISVDSFGYFALSCEGDGKAYIYDSSMNYTNKYIGLDFVLDARLDINNYFAIGGQKNVKIYS